MKEYGTKPWSKGLSLVAVIQHQKQGFPAPLLFYRAIFGSFGFARLCRVAVAHPERSRQTTLKRMGKKQLTVSEEV